MLTHPQEQRVAVLQARISERDQAMAELEQTASKQMHGLAEQSSQALETLQRKLTLAESQLHQLHTFIKVSKYSVCLRFSFRPFTLGDNLSLDQSNQLIHITVYSWK